MAVLWHLSLTPRHDPSDAPYSGAKAYFFDVGTTTPQVVYTDAALSIPHDHPVEADANGVFPAVFFPDQSSHRLRITTSEDVTLHDVDNISVPTTTPPEFPSSDTDPELLFATGDIKMAWRTSTPNGWVRANGRTIGSASSGAAERANADCEDLFKFLWDNDANLSVSGGRGVSSSGDWSANKTIALPDFRGRVPGGRDSMGNSAANRITDAVLGDDSDELGGVGGAQQHTLVEGELPAVTVSGNTGNGGAHTHFMFADVDGAGTLTNSNQANRARTGAGDQNYAVQGSATAATLGLTSAAADHTHTFSDSFGSDDPHNNLQPSILLTFFIKL